MPSVSTYLRQLRRPATFAVASRLSRLLSVFDRWQIMTYRLSMIEYRFTLADLVTFRVKLATDAQAAEHAAELTREYETACGVTLAVSWVRV